PYPVPGWLDQGWPPQAEQGDRRQVHLPRLVLSRSLERHLRPTARGHRSDPGREAGRDRAPPQARLMLRRRRRADVDGGEDRQANQPRARRANAAHPGAAGGDRLSLLSDDVPRRDRGEGRRDPVAGERPRPVPGRVDRRRGTTPDHHVWLTLVLPGAYCTEAM